MTSISETLRDELERLKFVKDGGQGGTAVNIEASCAKQAKRWKVAAGVHPKDFIMDFLLTHPHFIDSPELAVEYYFKSGHESAQLFERIVERDLGINGAPLSLLEFASGYGCVTRHLLKARRFQLTACDIHAEANDFNATRLGATAMQSRAVPEEFDAGGLKFDLVFALSFFSHMPKHTWARWLQALFEVVSPEGGHLIFTTHGPTSMRKVLGGAVLDAEGFYFHAASEQGDLEVSEYGTTITDNRFVVGALPRDCELRLVRAGLWWEHQDLYVIRRGSG